MIAIRSFFIVNERIFTRVFISPEVVIGNLVIPTGMLPVGS